MWSPFPNPKTRQNAAAGAVAGVSVPLGGSSLVVGALPEGFEARPGLVPLGVFKSRVMADEFGLAVLAMGQTYWTFFEQGSHILCVEAGAVDRIRTELSEFAEVRRPLERGDRQNVPPLPDHSVSWEGPVVYLCVLAASFGAQLWTNGEWTRLGRSDALAIFGNGEWWRGITALLLHADGAHLFANLLAGGGFLLLVSRIFGAPLAWALTLLAGIGGTFLTAAIYYPDPHLSVGASTAVFGGLGLLTGAGVVYGYLGGTGRRGLARWVIPLLGGIVLLGFLGAGAEGDETRRIDVLAHLAGFAVGGVIGVPATLAVLRLAGRRPVWLDRGSVLFMAVILVVGVSAAVGAGQ